MEHKKTKEELIINEIIDSCNAIIDQITLGAEPTDADYNALGYVNGAISSIKNRVVSDLDNQITKDVQEYKSF
tara:strand:- start:1800 stop:2018 length:219 start_codon:yes stop_codon:yes gene_type:complete